VRCNAVAIPVSVMQSGKEQPRTLKDSPVINLWCGLGWPRQPELCTGGAAAAPFTVILPPVMSCSLLNWPLHLPNLHDAAFQVSGFGHGQKNRVVHGLPAGFKKLEASATRQGCLQKNVLEHVMGHVV